MDEIWRRRREVLGRGRGHSSSQAQGSRPCDVHGVAARLAATGVAASMPQASGSLPPWRGRRTRGHQSARCSGAGASRMQRHVREPPWGMRRTDSCIGQNERSCISKNERISGRRKGTEKESEETREKKKKKEKKE